MMLVALVLVLLGIGALIKQVATVIRSLTTLLAQLATMYVIVLVALVWVAGGIHPRG